MNWRNEIDILLRESPINTDKIMEIVKGNVSTKLYRYRNYSPNWKSEFLDYKIFLSSPHDFNDPFDCSVQLTKKELLSLAELMNPSMTRQEIKEMIQLKYDDLIEYGENFFKNNTRIACFTPKYDSILMWSHYAGFHRGYCIEYDITKFNNKIQYLFPVIYSKNRVNATQIIKDKFPQPFVYKYSEWEYEEEWRYISMTNDKKVPKNIKVRDSISAIYLGVCIEENEDLKFIVDFATQNSIPLYKMRPSKKQYKLVKEKYIN